MSDTFEPPQWSPERFLIDIQEKQSYDKPVNVLTWMFRVFDMLLVNGLIAEVQKVVDLLDVTKYKSTILIGFCTKLWIAQRDGLQLTEMFDDIVVELKQRQTQGEDLELDIDRHIDKFREIPDKSTPTIGDILRSIGSGNQEMY